MRCLRVEESLDMLGGVLVGGVGGKCEKGAGCGDWFC